MQKGIPCTKRPSLAQVRAPGERCRPGAHRRQCRKATDLTLFGAAAGKLGVTRLQPYIHDVRAMSACAPTADVSLQRGR